MPVGVRGALQQHRPICETRCRGQVHRAPFTQREPPQKMAGGNHTCSKQRANVRLLSLENFKLICKLNEGRAVFPPSRGFQEAVSCSGKCSRLGFRNLSTDSPHRQLSSYLCDSSFFISQTSNSICDGF